MLLQGQVLPITSWWTPTEQRLVPVICRSRQREESRSLYVFGWQGGTDVQIYNTLSLYRLKVRWIQMPDFLLARKCIHLLHPLRTLPCIAYWPGFVSLGSKPPPMVRRPLWDPKEHKKGMKNTFQGQVYNFLERPTGWKCFIYHFTV